MAKRMKLWVIGALLLGVVGSVVASNMGFKFVPNLTDPGSVANFTHAVSIPLNHNYTTADSVTADILASCPSASPQLIRINPSAGASSTNFWAPGGGAGAVNFPIVKGVGYQVSINSACTSWVLVGSHDPAFVYGPSTSWFQLPAKTYLTSVPYHTTATNADQLLTSIPNGSKIERLNPSVGATSTNFWQPGGGAGAINFAVVIGQAYRIEVSAASTWTPAHY